MSRYVLEQNGALYRIELNQPRDLSDFSINSTFVHNDRFTKYEITATLDGSMYKIDEPTDGEKKDDFASYTRTLNKETYDEYLKKKRVIPAKNTTWIYNIVDGKSEQERILYKEDDFVVIPTYTWNGDHDKLHVLGIVRDKDIMTIRDLNSSHVKLLQRIQRAGLDTIKKHYNVESNMIRVYLHYPPSTWLLHVHFEIITHISNSCVTEHCHNLDMVMQNLQMDSDYYKKVIMTVLE